MPGVAGARKKTGCEKKGMFELLRCGDTTKGICSP
jgi:hypothetical protein